MPKLLIVINKHISRRPIDFFCFLKHQLFLIQDKSGCLLPTKIILEDLFAGCFGNFFVVELIPFHSDFEVGVVVAGVCALSCMDEHAVESVLGQGRNVQDGAQGEHVGIFESVQNLFVYLGLEVELEALELDHKNGANGGDLYPFLGDLKAKLLCSVSIIAFKHFIIQVIC